jgi:hypothetical protein
MNKALRWVFGIMGLVLVGVTPHLWFINPDLLWIAIPLLCMWAFWLMLEYLSWAKTMGRK